MDGRSGGQPVQPTALVIQTAFLGDVVLTTPLISVLAGRHGPVDVVTTPAAVALLETHPGVHSVIRYDKHGADKGLRGMRRLSSELRARRSDPEVAAVRWMVEELRVSLFAQSVGTAGPVSEQRIRKELARLG